MRGGRGWFMEAPEERGRGWESVPVDEAAPGLATTTGRGAGRFPPKATAKRGAAGAYRGGSRGVSTRVEVGRNSGLTVAAWASRMRAPDGGESEALLHQRRET
jgi:hypothetical protein